MSVMPERNMSSRYEAGQRAWPEINLSFEEFAAFADSRRPPEGPIPADFADDVFLACACARNVPHALRCFRDRFAPVVAAAVRRFDDSDAFAEEVYQRLSELLFVDGPEHPAKIGLYSGTGSLAAFVGTTARRIALRLTANSGRFQGEEALIQQFSQIHEQETSMLRMRHREIFNRALSVALRQLPRRERLILRMNLVERVSTTKLAAMYKVSQPTISRWIQKTAQNIFTTVKETVCDELEIDTRELESLLLLVRSQIEITILNSVGSIHHGVD